ncbi:MAG: DUF1611 domain-containing protein [Planctomycetota bacterium]
MFGSARRIAILTEGNTTPLLAKTAASVLRYRRDEVVAIIDSTAIGADAGALLEVGEGPVVVGALADVPEADTLLLGISPAGGALPPGWRATILEAIDRDMTVVSGLHAFLADDREIAARAEARGTALVDLRRYDRRPIARAEGLDETRLRVLTVGQDCCVGKMVTAIELARGLRDSGRDAVFLATGQTGIAIAGSGAPIDAVPADFIAGAAERLVLEHQDHDILVGEGQGSLAHPSFSGVTLALLHGFAPHAMILCLECDRPATKGLDHVPLTPLETIFPLYESMAALRAPSRIIGLALNTRRLDEAAARARCRELGERFGLPATDVLRFGAAPLVEAVAAFRRGAPA